MGADKERIGAGNLADDGVVRAMQAREQARLAHWLSGMRLFKVAL